jgi:Ubiquitin carboxyl-terminal hydrolase
MYNYDYVSKNHCAVYVPHMLDLTSIVEVRLNSDWDSSKPAVPEQVAPTKNEALANSTVSPKKDSVTGDSLSVATEDRSHVPKVTDTEPVEADGPVLEEAEDQQTASSLLKDIIATNKRFQYRLKSVILHYGGHDSGHFVALKSLDGIWYHISDANVTRVGDNIEQYASNVFMVFYEVDE